MSDLLFIEAGERRDLIQILLSALIQGGCNKPRRSLSNEEVREYLARYNPQRPVWPHVANGHRRAKLDCPRCGGRSECRGASKGKEYWRCRECWNRWVVEA